MTRILDPHERFKELSNAFVPYNFYPLLLIKSVNTYKLEKELRNEFNKKRVNKVNYLTVIAIILLTSIKIIE